MESIDNHCLEQILSHLNDDDLASLILTNKTFYEKLKLRLANRYNDIIIKNRWVALKNNIIYFNKIESKKIKRVPDFDYILKKIDSGKDFMMALSLSNKLWIWGSQNFVFSNIVDFSCDIHWITLNREGIVNFNGQITDFSDLKPIKVWTCEEDVIVICRKTIHLLHPKPIVQKLRKRVFNAKINKGLPTNHNSFILTVKNKDGWWRVQEITRKDLTPFEERIAYQADKTFVGAKNFLGLFDGNIYWPNYDNRIFYPSTLNIKAEILDIKIIGLHETAFWENILHTIIITTDGFYFVLVKGRFSKETCCLELMELKPELKKFLAKIK